MTIVESKTAAEARRDYPWVNFGGALGALIDLGFVERVHVDGTTQNIRLTDLAFPAMPPAGDEESAVAAKQ